MAGSNRSNLKKRQQISPFRGPPASVLILIVRIVGVEVSLAIVGIEIGIRNKRFDDQFCP